VESDKIRQLAKKHCVAPPYAYECTFKNVEGSSKISHLDHICHSLVLVVENVNKNSIIDKCASKEFNGKIIAKTSNKFILESDDFLKLLLEINAIK
jgi:hypothetical protein